MNEPLHHILLIGMMGSGKTTVGRLLAQRLGWEHVDSDLLIEASTGKTVREIFETLGEAAFRAEEARALKVALSRRHPSVISVAGGAVLDEENRRVMMESEAKIVWLRANLDLLAERVKSGDHRPLLGKDPARALSRLYDIRRPFYAQLANEIVNVDGLSPASVVGKIVKGLHL